MPALLDAEIRATHDDRSHGAARDRWLISALSSRLTPAQSAQLSTLTEGRVWDVVIERGWLEEHVLIDIAAAAARLPRADLAHVSNHALALVPEKWARRFHVLPLGATESRLVLATAHPYDVDCERTLGFATGRAIEFALASPRAIGRAIDLHYRGDVAARAPERHVEVQHLGRDADAAPPSVLDDSPASITRLVDELLGEGIASRASDIHIEAEEQGIAVRHRVDGVLQVVRRLPRALGPALVSRIKILSGLDIADRLRPQDGRARVAVNGVAVDLRISTLPASHGEKVVIRVLDSRASLITLDRMGFNTGELARVERLLDAKEGLILVTGPTGSGKTTTLYAALRLLKQRGVNIVTVEDPIEYRLPGIVQVQVHERAGLTFASALRSIMRQDPDVLLIGEIRDRETAEIAIQASLTGHLVLSTLHTNDAASAVTRLIDIGVASYRIATAVKGVVAQRLLRRLCPECHAGLEAGQLSSEALVAQAQTGRRCVTCLGTGFRGRLAIVEVLVGTPEFERSVAANDPTERIAEVARAAGMRSLWQSGMEHVRRGETTLDELRRVTSPEQTADAMAVDVAPRVVSEPLLAGEAFVLRSDLDTMLASVESTSQSVDPAPFDALALAPLELEARTRYLTPRRLSAPNFAEQLVANVSISTIDVYVIRPLPEGWQVLVMQRALDTRCPGAWESVHGRMEAGEEPEDAAVREVREETGLEVQRLYNVTVQPFYLHRTHTVQLAVVFAAFVGEPAEVTIGPEHQRFEWLTADEATKRFHWPRESAALAEIRQLLATGDAGPVEDVLRIF